MNHFTRLITLICAVSWIAGCSTPNSTRSGSNLPSTPDVVAYCHESFMERIDLGKLEQSHGDLITWSADVFEAMPESGNRIDAEAIGLASGYMIVTRPNHEVGDAADSDREFRLSTMTMSWNNTDDSLIFSGLHAYAHHVPRLDNTVTRTVVGGTGRFLGRPGIATVTPEGDAWFKVQIYLAQ